MNNPIIARWRNSITIKIFLVTFILLVVSACLIYSAFYFYLPSFYEKNKLDRIDAEVERLVQDIETHPLDEAKSLIAEAASQTNSLILLQDNTGSVLSLSTIYQPSLSNTPRSLHGQSLQPDQPVASGIVSTGNSQVLETYVREIPILLAGQEMTLKIHATLQPINEASQVMVLFIPNIALITLTISVLGAYIYSRIIARPLIKLNQAARKMANLEFPTVIKFSSADEIGQLSGSLNEMSLNLQQTMNHLQRSNDQLQLELMKEREIEDQRRRLFAMISHELKSPLTAVKGQLEGMIYGLGVYKDRDKYLKRSNDILDHMEELIYEILQISKLEQHTFMPNNEKLDLKEVIDDAVYKNTFYAEKHNVQLVSDVPQSVYILSDQDLVEKAVFNIIHNAIVHSEQGERVEIRLVEQADAGGGVFTVLNTGSHIPEQQLHKVFEPFFRLDETRNRNNGGTGLGLFLVKSIFEALSVEYAICNIPDGVLFRVVFIAIVDDAENFT